MSSEKRKVVSLADVSRHNLLTLRCGDCSHHKGSPHPAFGKPCNALGVKVYAAAPACFAPNVGVFRKAGPTIFAQLTSILATFSPQQSRVLMGLLRSAGSLEKYGYSFLDKVYFRSGDDYLDNYFSGYILGVGYQGTLAVVGGSFFTSIRNPVVAYLLPESFVRPEVFAKRKKRLIKEGKLYAPRKPHKNVIKDGDYEPPTMETSPEALEQAARQVFKAKAKGKNPVPGSLKVNLKEKPSDEEIEDDELNDD